MQVLKAFEGGPEAFISLTGVSNVTGYDSLSGHLRLHSGSIQQVEKLCFSLDNYSAAFEDFVVTFLKGQGIPCPGLFDSVSNSLSIRHCCLHKIHRSKALL